MDLSLTEEQEALREAVARMLDKRSSAEQVRDAEPLGFRPEVWAGFAEMGLLEVVDPSDPWQMTLGDLAIVAEEAGAHLAPAPIVEALVAARLLGRLGAPTDTADIVVFTPRPRVGAAFT